MTHIYQGSLPAIERLLRRMAEALQPRKGKEMPGRDDGLDQVVGCIAGLQAAAAEAIRAVELAEGAQTYRIPVSHPLGAALKALRDGAVEVAERAATMRLAAEHVKSRGRGENPFSPAHPGGHNAV